MLNNDLAMTEEAPSGTNEPIRQPRIAQEWGGERMFIYAIRSGDYTKVGISRDIVQRFDEMTAMNPHQPYLVMYRTVTRNSARTIEMRMHELLAPWHYYREWFTAPIAEIRAAAKRAIQESAKVERRERKMEWAADVLMAEAKRRALARGPCRPQEFDAELKRFKSELRRKSRSYMNE